MNADGSIIKCHLVIEYRLEHVAESNQSWLWMYMTKNTKSFVAFRWIRSKLDRIGDK